MDTIPTDSVTLPWIASLAIGLGILLVTAGLLLAALGIWPRRREVAERRDGGTETAATDDPRQARPASLVGSAAR